MNKVLVVDGLARSGTTLINSIINSQTNTIALRGCFHELLSMGYPWPEGGVLANIHSATDPISFNDNINRCTNSDEKKYYTKTTISWKQMKEFTLDKIEDLRQYGSLNHQTWLSLLDRDVSSLSDLDKLYSDICETANVQTLSLRWNQAISYAPIWLNRKNHYWLAVVRNPFHRALSAQKAFSMDMQTSVAMTTAYAKKLETLKNNPNFKIIYYEDILENPHANISNICNWLGNTSAPVIDKEFVNTDGEPHRRESSKLVGTSIDRKTGILCPNISPASKYDPKNEIESYDFDKIKKCIENYPVYSRYH
ncbi:hypothetical protein [Kiloniella sp.]|uniref:hypothetical protein n=1 Tax=Kiloniella sp. TaxID=1938587 RepID=UPI003A94F472